MFYYPPRFLAEQIQNKVERQASTLCHTLIRLRLLLRPADTFSMSMFCKSKASLSRSVGCVAERDGALTHYPAPLAYMDKFPSLPDSKISRIPIIFFVPSISQRPPSVDPANVPLLPPPAGGTSNFVNAPSLAPLAEGMGGSLIAIETLLLCLRTWVNVTKFGSFASKAVHTMPSFSTPNLH